MMTPPTRTVRLVLAGLLAAFPAVFLSACGSGSSGKPAVQKSIAGCDIPATWMPERMLEEVIVEGFRDEHAVTDPQALAEMNALFTNRWAATSLDFDKWYGGNEDRSGITVRGMTMAKWEDLFKRTDFLHQPDVYPAICAGWTFERYLREHPNVGAASVTTPAPSSSATT